MFRAILIGIDISDGENKPDVAPAPVMVIMTIPLNTM